MARKDIHPKYYPKAKVICACGATFETGSTIPEIHVEICSNCHPFYTGKQKLIDTAGRLERFKKIMAKSKEIKKTEQIKTQTKSKIKPETKTEKSTTRPETKIKIDAKLKKLDTGK